MKMRQLLDTSSCRSNTSQRGNNSSSKADLEQTEFLPVSLVVTLSFVCLLIVAVNGLVIFLIHKKKSLRTITNMFLASLALSDLMAGLVGIPLLVICSVKDVMKVCVSSAIFIRFTAISSVCHVLLVACDRYIFIVHYMKYHSVATKRRAIAAVIFVWLLSLASSLVQLSWYIFHGIALTEYEDVTEDHNKRYSLACIVLFFTVPLITMCYIYGSIFYISFKRIERDRGLSNTFQRPSRSLRHEWRGRSVLLITMVIFSCCWLPFFVAMLDDHMNTSEQSSMSPWAQRLLIFLGFLPSVLNPILCTLAKIDFRRALKQIVIQWKRKNSFADFEVHHERICLKVPGI
ncbi:beta-2 adrenergic receptor-like [Orbicella faveolata]|uniref:beta-2 adrenergic receptor-like n=1 Tax=Orbicella faveolata TaxID=48498 RepID=UPI0009E52403|nr:beta-2 adrenergic receptor-like [Orbicella faveolata]